MTVSVPVEMWEIKMIKIRRKGKRMLVPEIVSKAYSSSVNNKRSDLF